MPFNFQSYTSPLTASIADRLAQQGAIEAQRAYATGNAAAQAAQQSGNAWAGAIQGIGQTIGALPGQIAAINRSNTVDQMNKIKLADAQRGQAGEQAVAGLLQGDQLPAGQEGPRRPSYLDENNLYDIPKLTAALGAQGFGDRAADLVKGAETINESITRHQATQAQLAKDQTILTGDMAHGALSLMTGGMPIDQAMDVASSAAVMSGSIPPAQYAKVKQQILGLPPDQQQAALEGIRNEAAKQAPTKVLAEGATETDRYGRPVAKGGEKPQDFTLGEGQVRYDKDGNAVAWGPDKPAPKLTLEEAELDAYAKSINKPDRTALTYADRQTFEANKETIRSNAAFQQHVRERGYDLAHPTPEKTVVSVIGPDGKPVYVRASDAVGQIPGTSAEAKPPTDAEHKSLGFYNRANDAVTILTTPDASGKTLEDKVSGADLAAGQVPVIGNYLQSEAAQQYTQAQRAFTEARLRRESGATITANEYASDAKIYFKQPGDSDAVVKQKQEARKAVLNGLAGSAGRAYEADHGTPFTPTTGRTPSAAPPGAAHAVGDIVTVKGQQVRITKVRPDGQFEGEVVR